MIKITILPGNCSNITSKISVIEQLHIILIPELTTFLISVSGT